MSARAGTAGRGNLATRQPRAQGFDCTRLLAEGFAQQASRWILAAGGAHDTALWVGAIAQRLSLETSGGQVCIDTAAAVEAMVQDDDGSHSSGQEGSAAPRWRERLLGSGIVGTPGAPGVMPLILDEEGRLYLHRFYDYERRLAARLRVAQQAPPDDTGSLAAMTAVLDRVFASASSDPSIADWQKIAVALALRQRLTIITGGPGTGKTTTVVNLLACLLELEPDIRIALAAPTGRAAARMTQAIAQRAAHLPAGLRARLPTESYTIHRLLGVRGGAHGFIHHADNRLSIDALVVDEASMLDLSLATRLLEAVPDDARIVLLGDKDQLAAVESGAVFSALCVNPGLSPSCVHDLAALSRVRPEVIVPPEGLAGHGMQDSVIWFTRNFRFASDSDIGHLAVAINTGDAPAALARLGAAGDAVVTADDAGGRQTGGDGAVRDDRIALIADGGSDLAPTSFEPLVGAYDHYLDVIESIIGSPAGAQAAARAHAAFSHSRVLCAVRRGARGVSALNERLEARLRGRLHRPEDRSDSPWYPGRAVLVLHNDYLLRLFNGDVGIALPDADGLLRVWFARADGDWHAIAPARMPEHEPALAMTVHKAQGSEFDQVHLVLPEHGSPVLTRELLYTAITRARQRVTVIAGADILTETIRRRTERRSGLLARLKECAGAPDDGSR